MRVDRHDPRNLARNMSAAQKSYLVEILLPKETGHGKPIEQQWFEDLLTELTGKFGGATSFIRAPGLGLWRSGDETQRDNIAVIEVMAGQLEPEYWKRLRERLERELSQDEVAIRAQEIRQL
jgi:hypothetical protein